MAIDFRGAVIGVLDSAELAGRDYSVCLSAEERDTASRIRSARRREEWLAARILAKYLRGTGLPDWAAQAGTPVPRLLRVTCAALTPVADEQFREMTVTGVPPRISWNGRTQTIAISHTNGLACVAVGRGTIQALDVETRTARVAPFYERNFTPREREWADGCCREYGMDRDWVYTLLWSMKECMLKTPAFQHLSIWDMPRIEIAVHGDPSVLRAPHEACTLEDDFAHLETEVNDGHRTVPACMAVAGTRDLVLTASKTISERKL
jgi:phosphopantetheinyl transferase